MFSRIWNSPHRSDPFYFSGSHDSHLCDEPGLHPRSAGSRSQRRSSLPPFKGAVASFECSFNETFYNGFEVVGTKSRLISIHSLRQTSDPVESLCHLREDGSKLYFPLQASNIYVDELRHFAQVLFQNTPTLIPAEIGLLNQRVVEAAYQSLEKHKEITI